MKRSPGEGTAALFPLDARRLDDRPPLLDLGAMQSTKLLWRLLVGREYLLANLAETRRHRRIGQGLHDSDINPMTSFGVPFGAQSPNHCEK